MWIDSLKLSFLTYIHHLGMYDYLGLAWYAFTFLMLIVLAIFVANRSSALSLLIIIGALIFFTVTPFILKEKLNTLLRSHVSEIQSIKKLSFSDSVIVEATLQNSSKKPFNRCLIQTTLYKKSSAEGWRLFIEELKPLRNQSILVEHILAPDESMEYQSVVEDFTYNGEIRAKLKAECY